MRFTKLFTGAAAVVALALAGCSSTPSSTETEVIQSGEVQSSDLPEEVATEEGLALVEAFNSCEAVGELATQAVPGVLDGLDLIVEDGGAGQPTACDWQNDAGGVLVVELSPFEQTVPTAEGVAEAGGAVVEAAKVSEAGGVVYTLPGEAEAVTGVVSTGRATVQYAGLEGMDQAKAVSIVESLLGL